MTGDGSAATTRAVREFKFSAHLRSTGMADATPVR